MMVYRSVTMYSIAFVLAFFAASCISCSTTSPIQGDSRVTHLDLLLEAKKSNLLSSDVIVSLAQCMLLCDKLLIL